MQELVSVIIPVWNGEKYIKDCLYSVVGQTYKNVEIIIVDDGSEDHTVEICRRMQEMDQRIRIFCQKNQGVSVARNKGIELAAGKYLVFLDSDDMLHPAFLEKTLARAGKTGADVIGCRFRKVSTDRMRAEANKDFGSCPAENWKSISVDKILNWFCNVRETDLSVVTCKLIKRELIGEQRFEIGIVLGEDTLFMYYLARKGFKLEVSDAQWYLYRMHSESAVHNWEHMKAYNSYVVYTRIRDEEYQNRRYGNAEKLEECYLGLLTEKYLMAKNNHQKEICEKLRREAIHAIRYPGFSYSRIKYILLLYCKPLYDFCTRVISSYRERKGTKEK